MIYINNRKEVTYVNFAWYGYTNGFQYAVHPDVEQWGPYMRQIVDSVDGQGNPRTIGKGAGFGGRIKTNSQNQGYGVATEYQTSIPMKYPDGTVRLVGSPIINGFLLSDKELLGWVVNRYVNEQELRKNGEWTNEDNQKAATAQKMSKHWAQFRMENGKSPNFDPEIDSFYYPDGFEQAGDDYGEYYYSDGMPKVYNTEEGKEPVEASREEASNVFDERYKQAKGDPESMSKLRGMIPIDSEISRKYGLHKEVPVSKNLPQGCNYEGISEDQKNKWDREQNDEENDKAWKESQSQKTEQNEDSSKKTQ